VKVIFIVNPNSANGATRARFAQIQPELGGIFPDMRIAMTEAPGHATELARHAVESGYDAIVACGGDGTLNEVVAGLHLSGRPDAVMLGMIPSGTGGDFRKTSGFPRETADTLRYLSSFRERRIDYGLLEYRNLDGTPGRRPFINIASIGISGVTDDFVNHTTKRLGGKASFMIGSFRGIMSYRNVGMTVIVDGETVHKGPTSLVTMANGRFFGGGMMMAPDAELDDGLFSVVVLGDMGKVEFLMLAGDIYKGTHVGHPKCVVASGKIVEVLVEDRALIDLDGEMPGMGPVRATVIPSAIRLMVPAV